MMLMTTTIAIPVTYTARFKFFRHHLATAAGMLSLGFGLFLVYQIGFVGGLFTR
jgi:high-affinity nickel-transport protein